MIKFFDERDFREMLGPEVVRKLTITGTDVSELYESFRECKHSPVSMDYHNLSLVFRLLEPEE
jgi:hypothetical protein